MNIYWSSAIAFVFFAGVGAVLARWFKIEGPMMLFFISVLSMLVVTITAMFYWAQDRFKNRQKAADGDGGGAGGGGGAAATGDVAVMIREADNRLSASRHAQGA